ncbi:hypothetical protein GCM10028786_15690 [Flaviaesturariibacter terrae]
MKVGEADQHVRNDEQAKGQEESVRQSVCTDQNMEVHKAGFTVSKSAMPAGTERTVTLGKCTINNHA